MRVLIVEDEPTMASALGDALTHERLTVDTAGDGRDALGKVHIEQAYDLILLDLMMPHMDGLTFLRTIRAEGHTMPVLVLTARDLTADKVTGLDTGADDYLTKPFSPRELTARVRALLRRARSDDEPQADVLERAGGRLVVDSARRRATLDGAPVDLTESEFRLLQTLARFPGRVYTRFELVDKVQGYQFEGYERTIDAHVKNLRRKLGEDARDPRLILTVYGRGYAFAEEQK